jgi:hypothetical protein
MTVSFASTAEAAAWCVSGRIHWDLIVLLKIKNTGKVTVSMIVRVVLTSCSCATTNRDSYSIVMRVIYQDFHVEATWAPSHDTEWSHFSSFSCCKTATNIYRHNANQSSYNTLSWFPLAVYFLILSDACCDRTATLCRLCLWETPLTQNKRCNINYFPRYIKI